MIQNGEILGGMYRIIDEIGHGGTGIIYLADHLRLRKRVVVKKIKDNYAGHINGRAEADILKKLHHTYLPQVYDFLQIGTTIYTVMEYVEGADLQHYIEQGQRFSEQTLLHWLAQLSEVLEYLHQQMPPILHSDIKPANIMITPQGNVCLIDFNISLDGEDTKDVRGISQWYAAPEQYEKVMARAYGGRDSIILDARMDIYSLGATFYTLMSGYLPNPQQDQFVPVIYMDIPYSDGLKAVIYKAMQRQPGKRFRNAAQMQKAVKNVSQLDPVYRRIAKFQAAAIVIYGLCIIVGVLLIYYGNWRSSREHWQEAYQNFYEANEEQAEEEIVGQGIEILNAFRYKSYLKSHQEERAEILHAIGESYFRQDKFEEAVPYYKEAYDIMPGLSSYCQDYMIALVRSHQTDEAKKLLRNAEVLSSLEAETIQLIQAELLTEEGNDEDAVPLLDTIRENGSDGHKVHAALLEADIYKARNDFENETAVLKSAAANTDSLDILRRYGEAAVNAFSETSKSVYQNQYLEEALRCYETLNQKNKPSYEDRMNLALVRRMAGQYQGSIEVLKSLKQSYPEDYKIGMWMCYGYLDQARENNSYESVKGDLWYAFNESKKIYQENKTKTDEEMEQLIEIMNELEG